jgi:hypothetical protein
MMMPMYVGKAPLQPALKRQMHGRHYSVLPRTVGVDVMVERKNVENDR